LGSEQEASVLEEIYPTLPDISIDYGVMEKCGDILVLPAEFGWSDVGSWDMLGAIHAADEHNNVAVGDVLLTECQNSTVYANGRTVALLGVENLVVVETPDAVMVCPKDRAQDVKQITEKLKEMGKKELL
ncbi:MAG: mannose-1-phosphate guanylyltransferase, partial [Clostridia bacterium]|nr:mannose-1-phosphate guanylyltransferase [Clostridia bacterium]